jgi:plastocyanin
MSAAAVVCIRPQGLEQQAKYGHLRPRGNSMSIQRMYQIAVWAALGGICVMPAPSIAMQSTSSSLAPSTPPPSATTDSDSSAFGSVATNQVSSPAQDPSSNNGPASIVPHSSVGHHKHRKPAKKSAAPPHAAGAAPATATPTAAKAVVGTEIKGRVDLTAGRGQQLASGAQAETVVYFVPKIGNVAPKHGQYTVYTDNHDFKPAAIAIPKGSTVIFNNVDQVRHNVYSTTPDSGFDLGFQATGEKVEHVFNNPGFVLVGCKVHQHMELDVLVVPTSFVTSTAADGSFTLRNLPAGPGMLYFWNPSAGLAGQSVTLPLTAAIAQHMVAIKPHVVTELHVGSNP